MPVALLLARAAAAVSLSFIRSPVVCKTGLTFLVLATALASRLSSSISSAQSLLGRLALGFPACGISLSQVVHLTPFGVLIVFFVPSAISVVLGPPGILFIVAALICIQGFHLQILIIGIILLIVIIEVLLLGLLVAGHIGSVASGPVRLAAIRPLGKLPGPLLVVGPSTVFIPVSSASVVRSLLIHVNLTATEAEDPFDIMGLISAAR